MLLHNPHEGPQRIWRKKVYGQLYTHMPSLIPEQCFNIYSMILHPAYSSGLQIYSFPILGVLLVNYRD